MCLSRRCPLVVVCQIAAGTGVAGESEAPRPSGGLNGERVDGSACNNWQISLYLVPYGTKYVMTAAPGDYHAVHSDC